MEESELDPILSAIATGTVDEITVGNFTFDGTQGYRDEKFLLKHNGDELESYSVSHLDKSEILDYFELESIYKSSINNWEVVRMNNSVKEWETPYDGNSLEIVHSRNFSVRCELENAGSFDDLNTAEMVAFVFMKNHDPLEVDYELRMREAAKEEFREISGIGKQTARSLVSTRNVTTFEGILDNLSEISREYRNEAEKEIEDKIENDEFVSNNPKVSELTSEKVLEKL